MWDDLWSFNWHTLAFVTPLHLFTFNFTKLGQPSPPPPPPPPDLTPVSEMGQFLMQSFFRAVNLAAMNASSESPTVSVLQIAIRSSAGQLEASTLKEPTVARIPIRLEVCASSREKRREKAWRPSSVTSMPNSQP